MATRSQRKRNKRIERKNTLKSLLIIGLIFIPIIIFIHINGNRRKAQLQNESFETIAVIEHLKEKTRKGKTTRQDILYFYFLRNDTIFHKIESISSGGISKLKIKKGNAFKLRVVEYDYSIFDLDITQELDTTLILKEEYINKYNTKRHKKIIKNALYQHL